MTSTERVLAAINFRPPDRLPIWDVFWDTFPDKWRRYMGFDASVNPEDYYGIDVARCVANESFFPSQMGMVRDEGDYVIQRDGWGKTVRVGKSGSYLWQTVETVLNEPSDLDKLEFEPADLEMRYEGFAEEINRQRKAGRCIFAKVGGLYVRSQFLRGEDKLLVDMALDEGFCDALFDKVLRHATGMALETLKRTAAWETGLFVYDDMANINTTMFSPAMFERYLLPRYKRLIATCRAAGCKRFFFHCDGNIRPFIDLLLDAGFQGFHPLEPRCGLDLPRLREQYGKRIVFFGGVCNTRILPRGDRKEIEAHIRPLIELGREGGLILGSASIAGDVPPEAYDFYASLVRV